ncbi:GTP 3',8-cyclase MoaA [Bacteriovoracaceae bacterium]|nr:GTP 3',8-cyclase MoaA [Bacteriovoracaceae bacterium]
MNISKNSLIDQHGRRMRKVRVSLLDACNFKCLYCLPDNPKFVQSKDLLNPQEIFDIVSVLQKHGIEEVRMTGGEPLLRREFREIATGLSKLNLRKLGLTTNGKSLEGELEFLKSIKCHHLNISLDCLNASKFKEITGSNSYDKVIQAIKSASRMGFNVKINVVMMRGVNDDQIFDFIKFAEENNVAVRFLELMKIGVVIERNPNLFISMDEIVQKIETNHNLQFIQSEKDSTSYNYLIDGKAQIGFIASESKPFCGDCSRWRLSSKGKLRACLMSSDGVDLRNIDSEKYLELFQELLPMKPLLRGHEILEPMNQIGG